MCWDRMGWGGIGDYLLLLRGIQNGSCRRGFVKRTPAVRDLMLEYVPGHIAVVKLGVLGIGRSGIRLGCEWRGAWLGWGGWAAWDRVGWTGVEWEGIGWGKVRLGGC